MAGVYLCLCIFTIFGVCTSSDSPRLEKICLCVSQFLCFNWIVLIFDAFVFSFLSLLSGEQLSVFKVNFSCSFFSLLVNKTFHLNFSKGIERNLADNNNMTQNG